jgi:hypothetical protein
MPARQGDSSLHCAQQAPHFPANDPTCSVLCFSQRLISQRPISQTPMRGQRNEQRQRSIAIANCHAAFTESP